MTRSQSERPAVLMKNFHTLRPLLLSAVVLSALLSFMFYGMPGGRASGGEMQETQALEVGKTVARSIQAGAQHVYTLTLTAGQLLRVGFEPQGFDMTVTLYAPDGRKLAEVTRRDDGGVSQSLVLITESGGAHRVEARTNSATGGDYEITLEVLRPATTADRPRIAAEQAYQRGLRLQFEVATPDALREASRHYRDALTGWREAADSAGEARALGSLGAISSSLGEFHQAAGFYEDQLKLFEAAGDLSRQAPLCETIGWLYFNSLRDKSRSIKYLSEAQRLYGKLADRAGETRTLMLLGQVYIELGESRDEMRKSLDSVTEALAAYIAQGDPYGQGEAYGLLMLAWEKLQRPRAAVFFGKKSVNIYQELRTGMKDLKLERDTRQTFIKSKEQVYRTLAELLINENRLLEAEQVLDMLKEEEFSDFIRSERSDDTNFDASRIALEGEDEKLEKAFGRIKDISLERERLVAGSSRKARRGTKEEKEIERRAAGITVANEDFDKLLESLLRRYGQTGKNAVVQEVSEGTGLRSDLPEIGQHVAAIYTLVGDDKYYLFIITPEKAKAYVVPITKKQLGLKVIEFRDALQNRESDPLPIARELYDILIAPAREYLEDVGVQTLMWSLDGALRYIPIAALYDGKKYLVERFNISVFTSASKARLKNVPREKWQGLGFGVSKAHPGFLPLDGVPGELRGIIRDEGGGEPDAGIMPGRIFLDALFTKESLKKELEGGYPLVHIASHFKFRNDTDAGSFLLLGNGDRLSLRELGKFNFKGVDLLTLSACQTAVGGTSVDGIEFEGIGMFSQKLGAKSVVATLWRVADQTTPILMQDFYRERNAQPGIIKTEALRRAQVAMLRGEGRASAPATRVDLIERFNKTNAGRPLSHPYYWAPFILIGNWK